MHLFVTDGNLRSTLAVVRGLGFEGVPVTVGAETASSLAGSSRYCRERVQYPSPLKEPRRFQEFLLEKLADCPAVLLPMSDITVRLAAELAPELMASGARWPFASQECVEQVQDKRHVLRVAASLGITCPDELLPEGSVIEDVAPRLRYPVVLKPRFSRYRQTDSWIKGQVRYAHNPAELINVYHACNRLIPDPLVQEWIEGVGCGVFLLLWDGELKAAFAHQRLREKPPAGGVSVLCESSPLDDRLVAQCTTLLSALRWQGPAMVEFKRDRSGQPVLMEVNGRFWGSLQLALDAGMNFPALLYRLATGERVSPRFDYRVGIRSRWLLGDFNQMLQRLLCRSSVGHIGPGNSRFRAVREFFDFGDPAVRFENPRRDDLGPFWSECASYLRRRMLPADWILASARTTRVPSVEQLPAARDLRFSPKSFAPLTGAIDREGGTGGK